MNARNTLITKHSLTIKMEHQPLYTLDGGIVATSLVPRLLVGREKKIDSVMYNLASIPVIIVTCSEEQNHHTPA